MTNGGILNGVRIIALTQFLLGPAATQYLADLGADVIKIEPPGTGAYERRWSGGDCKPGGVSAFFLLANRNLKSVTVDIRRPEGQDIIKNLVKDADVVIQNFRPGSLEKYGLGVEQLREAKPDLICASASGYGQHTSARHLPGQDLLLQAATGLIAATGTSGQVPTAAGAAIVDQHAASLLAMGILAALYHRERTGDGQDVEVTMVEAALDLQTEPVVYHLNGGHVQRPTVPLASAFHEAPYGIYPTMDGFIALSLSPVSLVTEALGMPGALEELEDPTLSFSRREDIYRRLAPLLAERSTDDLVKSLRVNGVWCSPVNDYDQALSSTEVRETNPLWSFDHAQAGNVTVLKHPVTYSRTPARLQRVPADLGSDTLHVLVESGIPIQDVMQLKNEGIVSFKTPPPKGDEYAELHEAEFTRATQEPTK